MKKILGMLLYGGVMFGVTAGLGMFMMKKSAPHATTAENADGEEDTEAGEHGETPGKKHGNTNAGSHGSKAEHQTAELHGAGSHSVGQARDHGSAGHDEQLPVAVRSTPMTVEEIVRMGLSLKSRDESIRKREESLREIESQQRLVLADLASAQHEVENLLAQTSDQRAAKEELLARIAAQSESLLRERASFSGDSEKLKKEQSELELAKQALEAEKLKLTQTENELAIKRKSLEDDRKAFADTQTRVNQDSEKLARDRDNWLKDKESVDSDKRQVAQDRNKLDSDRLLLEQEKRAFLSTTGRTVPGAGADPNAAPVAQNPKEVAKFMEGMPPESAAKNLREMDAQGNTDLVVDILRMMEQRKSGAIMDALQDEVLASKFLLRMSTRNTEAKSAKKP
jgi:DNA repair exonuclease SbcCD ATPase subunit